MAPISTEEGTAPTREEVLRLPGPERLAWVERVRVFYPRWHAVADEIARCHRMGALAAEPACMLLTGPTGAGKTTLVASYAARYPGSATPEGTSRPVLRATIPSPATVKDLASAMLYALGDPRAGYGTTGGMTHRLVNFFRDCGVELLILDELQHFVDRDSRKVLLNASNWLKTLVKETGVACVLVGLEGEAEQVVGANPQLARLFGDPWVLAPFEWDEGRPRTIEEFRTFLGQMEAMLPLREPSRLADRETAGRCFLASGGVIGYLMALARRAAHLALLEGRERVDDALLAAAFDQRLAGRRRNIPNPFLGDATEGSEPESEWTRPTDAANRRSRARGPRRETLRDVV